MGVMSPDFTERTRSYVHDIKTFTALEGRRRAACVLGTPGPCEHGSFKQ